MIRDYALYMVFMFVLAVSIVVAYLVMSEFNDSVQAGSMYNADIKDYMQGQTDRFDNTYDYLFLTVLIGVILTVVILSYVLQTNPAMFFLLLIAVVIITGIAGFIANAFGEVILDPVLGASAANFPIITFCMNNYIMITLFTGFLMLIAFFAKPYEGM